MMLRMKERVTISVDPEVIEIARSDVEAGRAPNISAAIEEAVIARKRSRGLREAIDLWEAEFGPISEESKRWARSELKRAFEERSSSTRED
jgi:Arc/MetJ-type ribon-helix-helix transcriptional regulator